MAYESTTVPVERSQGEIRKLLTDYGAARFGFGEETDSAGVRWAAIQFAHGSHAVRMRVPHKPIDEVPLRKKAQRARTQTFDDFAAAAIEQEAKRIWRVIAWNLKARLVAVEEGVETFEEAFLAHLLNEQTGRTLYEELVQDGRIELGAPLHLALPTGA
jgi:hypothetical protein